MEGGREREGGREGEKEEGREEGRDGGREGKGGREGEKEGGREEGRDGGREKFKGWQSVRSQSELRSITLTNGLHIVRAHRRTSIYKLTHILCTVHSAYISSSLCVQAYMYISSSLCVQTQCSYAVNRTGTQCK